MVEERLPMANIAPFGLRMQPELKEQLEKAARENNRSLNSEIVQRLHDSVERGAADDLYFAMRKVQDEAHEAARDFDPTDHVIGSPDFEPPAYQAELHELSEIVMRIARRISASERRDS